MGYMEGRGVRRAHLTFELHDGRKVFAGTMLDGWWVSVYREGKCEQGGRGDLLSEALDDAFLKYPIGVDGRNEWSDVCRPLLQELSNA